GPMVLAVCRRLLRDAHDAEDAFQATFLVLVKKASSIRPRALVGNWLYGVACRTAAKARVAAARRRTRHTALVDDIPARVEHRPDGDVLRRLDGELSRMPASYRLPLVLCHLQGMSRRDAARTLGLTEGTLSRRLARGR